MSRSSSDEFPVRILKHVRDSSAPPAAHPVLSMLQRENDKRTTKLGVLKSILHELFHAYSVPVQLFDGQQKMLCSGWLQITYS